VVSSGVAVARFGNVIFDLDGTLVDTSEGVVNGIKQVFESLGLSPPDDRVIASQIGPPLQGMLIQLLQTQDASRLAEATRIFRAYYKDHGADESRPYDGILQMLQELQAAGVRLMIATNKPTAFALKILERFSMTPCFEEIVGQSLSAAGVPKRELLARLIGSRGLAAHETAMVGDSTGDIEAARSNDVFAIGVTWGYTPGDALVLAAPDLLCESVTDLRSALAGLSSRAAAASPL
jgi:phosphoglycolate phosphatase